MQNELSYYDPVCNYQDLQKAIFLATHHKFDLVSVPLGYATVASQFLGDTKVAAAIDLPYGNNPTPIRLHSILEASRRHIKVIDLVINHSLIANGQWKEFTNDIKACLTACRRNNLELRCMAEYRLFEPKKMLEIAAHLLHLGVQKIVSSTGSIMDDIVDNFILCRELQNAGVCPILASTSLSQKYVSRANRAGIPIIRFGSAKLVEIIYGGF